MKYFFINPPFFCFNKSPIIGIPELLGVLKDIKVETEVFDWNVDYFNNMFNKDYLYNYILFLCRLFSDDVFSELQSSLKNVLDEEKRDFKTYLQKLFYIQKRVDFYKFILKSKTFFYKQTLCEYAYNNASVLEKYVNFIAEKIVFSFFKQDEKFNVDIQLLFDFFDSKANQLINYYDDNVEAILEKNPDIVGITVNFPAQLISGLYLCLCLKRKNPNLHINIGGSFFTYSHQDISNLSELFGVFFDTISIKHSTQTVLDLVKYIKNEISIDEISNVIYKKNNEVVINKNSESNFPLLPASEFDGYDFTAYLSPEIVLPVRASLSCYWRNCIFCYCSGDKQYYIKPVEKFVDEIEYLQKKYKTKYFYFWDNVISPSYIEKFADILKERNLKIKYSFFARFEKAFNIKLLKKIKKSGCVKIYWGLDCVSEKVCDFVHKGIKFNIVAEVLKFSKKADISNYVFLLLGHPNETECDLQNGFDFIKSLKKYIDELIVYTKVLYMRDSIMWQQMEKYKKMPLMPEQVLLDYKNKFLSLFSFNPEEISAYEVIQYNILYLSKYGQKMVYLSTLFYLFLKSNKFLFNMYIKFYFSLFCIKNFFERGDKIQ